MATGLLPVSPHNCAWRGVINHDRMIIFTSKTQYYPTLPSGYPKITYPLEIFFWIRNLFTHGQAHPGRFTIDSETIDWCHYDASLIYLILISLLPRTIHFSKRWRASLRTPLTTVIVRDWENNGTICDSTCAARCHLLVPGEQWLIPGVTTRDPILQIKQSHSGSHFRKGLPSQFKFDGNFGLFSTLLTKWSL